MINSFSGYTRKDVEKITGINFQKIAFYTHQKLVIADIYNAVGKGKTRRFSKRNLVELLFIDLLSQNLLSLKKIRKILETFKKERAEIGKGIEELFSNNILEFETEEAEEHYEKYLSYKIDPFEPSYLEYNKVFVVIYNAQSDNMKIKSVVYPLETPEEALKYFSDGMINPHLSGSKEQLNYSSVLVINVNKFYNIIKL